MRDFLRLEVAAYIHTMMAGTVIQAAAFLHVSQPAVSRLIADLEREVGYPLFHRQTGRLQPTDEGNLLYAEVERAFLGMGEIEAAAWAIGQQQTGSLRLVTTYSVLGGPVLNIINEFAHDHPRVFIRVHNTRTNS
jgi:DNA-binding transcriptional LysR family regulator